MKNLFKSILLICLMIPILSACKSSGDLTRTAPEDTRIETQFDYLASEVNRYMLDKRFRTLLIADFWDAGEQVNTFGVYSADEITGRIASVERYNITDRSRLRSAAGSNPAAEEVFETARSLGVDAVVTGTVHDMGDHIRVNLRIVDPKKVEVLYSTRATIDRTAAYVRMIHNRMDPRPSQALAQRNRPAPANQDKNHNSPDKPKTYEPLEPLIRDSRQGFQFTMIHAKRINPSTVQVVLEILNENPDDRILLIQPYSRFFDNRGNEITRLRMRIEENHNNFSYLEHLMFPDEPAYLYMDFLNVPENATSIRMLDLRLWEERSDRFFVELKNIPIID